MKKFTREDLLRFLPEVNENLITSIEYQSIKIIDGNYSGTKSHDSAHPEPVEGWAECGKNSCFDKLNTSGPVNIDVNVPE